MISNQLRHDFRLLRILFGFILLSRAAGFQGQQNKPSFVRTEPSVARWSKHKADDSLSKPNFSLREAQFSELGRVADVIMSSFYVDSVTPWKQMFRMAELNRIQQGFPHIDKELHRHIVAVAEIDGTEEIIGFCDLDGRIPNRNTGYSYNPRPYLSDLCISPDWRRKGIAKAMIEESERYSIQVLGKDEIFIRVESTNEVALALYESLEYVQIPNPDCPKKHILLLKKRLESGVPVPVVIER